MFLHQISIYHKWMYSFLERYLILNIQRQSSSDCNSHWIIQFQVGKWIHLLLFLLWFSNWKQVLWYHRWCYKLTLQPLSKDAPNLWVFWLIGISDNLSHQQLMMIKTWIYLRRLQWFLSWRRSVQVESHHLYCSRSLRLGWAECLLIKLEYSNL